MNRQAALQLAGYTALFILFTLLFIPVNYPPERLTDQVNGWISPASKGALTVEEARIRPPLSVKVEGITLELDEGSLGLGGAVVKPGLLGLLGGKKSAVVHIENSWLSSNLKVISSREGWGLDVRSMDVDLSGLPDEIMPIPLDMDGRIEVFVNLLSESLSGGISAGEARISSGPVELGGDLLGSLGISPLHISRFSIVATVKDNVLTLGETSLEGDLAATARGTVRISPNDYMASHLDFTIELKPGPEKRDRLIPVFSMIGARPRADGTVSIRIRGTVGEPSVTL